MGTHSVEITVNGRPAVLFVPAACAADARRAVATRAAELAQDQVVITIGAATLAWMGF